MYHYFKPYDQLNFTDDFMFFKIMQDENICKGVIETLLNIKVSRIEYIQGQKTIDPVYTSKGVRLDVYAEDSQRVFDLEMQTTTCKDLGLRMRYYQSLIDIDHLEKGQGYGELKESYIIFICIDDPFKLGLPVYTFKDLCLESPEAQLNDKTIKVIYNVNNYKFAGQNPAKDFLQYLSDGKPNSNLTQQIDSALSYARKKEPWRREYMTWGLALEDAKERFKDEARAEGLAEGRTQGLAEGRTQGLAEGRTQGLAEGKAEGILTAQKDTALRLLKMGFSIEQVSEATTLHVEQIKELSCSAN